MDWVSHWITLSICLGLLAGCAVGLPCYWYGYKIGRGPSRSCIWGHTWGKYEPTQIVENSTGKPEVAQRRECSRCDAVDWRRVRVHN